MQKHLLSWCAGIVVLTFIALQYCAAQAVKDKALAKWEYYVMQGNDLKELNKLGDAGWEVIAIEPATPYVQGSTARLADRVVYLKRQK